MYRLLWLLLAPILLWLALILIGVDRFTDLSASPPLSRAIVGGWAVMNFYFTLRAYLVSDEPTYRIQRLKQGNRFGWIAAGILFAASLSALSGIVANRLVKTTAQYLPGEHRLLSGEVTAVRTQRGRGICRFYATVLPLHAGKKMRVCVQVNIRSAIGPLDLEPGQNVTLQVKDTLLGTVALGIKRDK